jgi:catechol 2,3-dioxygenase-like lactoylglutathione lyase family enzyme
MPNLENLRKQAKRYLRWRRQGYFPVAARIRTLLPRFRDLTDRQVMAAPFRLADAQELVARKHGFDSWAALIRESRPMTHPPAVPTQRATLVAAEPQLFVGDIAASLAFYDRLGFSVAFSYGEPPFFAQVVRDGARLNLRRVQGPVFDAAFRARVPDPLSATLVLDDAKPLFLEYQAAGVPFRQALRTEPWGARTFIVEDPDGNLLLFAGADA